MVSPRAIRSLAAKVDRQLADLRPSDPPAYVWCEPGDQAAYLSAHPELAVRDVVFISWRADKAPVPPDIVRVGDAC